MAMNISASKDSFAGKENAEIRREGDHVKGKHTTGMKKENGNETVHNTSRRSMLLQQRGPLKNGDVWHAARAR